MTPNIRSIEYMPREQQKLLTKIGVLRDCIAEQGIHNHQCQLLHSQLIDLKLYCEKLGESCQAMINKMEEDSA